MFGKRKAHAMDAVLPSLRRFIHYKVVEAFDTPAEIVKQAVTLFAVGEAQNLAYFDFLPDLDPRYPESDIRPHAERIVREECEDRAEAERSWTTPTRLERAFEQLNQEGVIALHNTGATLSDAVSDAMTEYAERYNRAAWVIGFCVYHGQDLDLVVPDGGTLLLGFGSVRKDAPGEGVRVGELIVRTIRGHGLEVSWDGNPRKRIEVHLADWRRRRKAG